MNADWIWGLIGGALIGTGGAVYLLCNGRIMGASGILGGLIDGSGRNTSGERIAFIAGVILVPLVIWLTVADAPDTHLTSNTVVIIAAGLLVGLGTRIANGCTSGHGVCGISRLSLRGLVATLIYILAGAVTLALFRHLWGLI
ncbi:MULTISPECIES: YeeE/YedE family protein [unclassified Phaeobacter]|uniref:YeeE/YedE family protein n=1 Tax=unclassified Phaeobacter TaxID=2621772 RepID=UPI003A8C1FD0